MSKRAERRYHSRRMKAKARWLDNEDVKRLDYMREPMPLAIKNADHLACCSCARCGNPRKWLKEKKTVQEQKADLKWKE